VIIDSHAQIPDRTAFINGVGEDPLPKMKESIDLLQNCQVDLIMMPCNTAHYFHSTLSEYAKVPILNMVELTAEHVREVHGSKEVMLLATTGTYGARIYQKYDERIRIPGSDVQEQLMMIIYLVKQNKIAEADLIMRQVISALDAQVLILGCTELSALHSISDYQDAIFIDPMDVMVDSLIEKETAAL
jgi:aspartate racemase